MIPHRFEYSKAKSVSDAIALLERYPDSKILAGGMSLIPVMKLRLASPKRLIDIGGLRNDLSYIRSDARSLSIGALTRHNEIITSDLVRSKAPALVDAAEVIGDEQVRNMGTLGGSLTHADPAADYAGVAIAMDAVVSVRGSRGTRTIPISDFFVDTFTTKLSPTELMTEINFPLKARNGAAYMKLERRAGDFATIGVASSIQVDSKGICEWAGIGLVSAGPTPIKARNAERELVGNNIHSDSVIRKAAEAAASKDASPAGDLKGDEEYKREMIKVFTERSLSRALDRTGA